jgi:ADP-ribose pyrophosphatase YjhB (NUDIX family)
VPPADARQALVVVETGGGIVLTHPPSGTREAPAALPGGLLRDGEEPEDGARRLVGDQTGLEVELVEELERFVQPGTPFGDALMFGYVARPVGGELVAEGPEGPVAVYPLDGLPAIIPVRVANQRVLAAYLASRP